MKKAGKLSNKKFWTAFAVINLISLTIYTIIILTCKHGYFSDEPWSYGLANSHYHPFIYGDSLNETNYIPGWFTGDDMNRYLSADPEHRFDYASVYYNQTKDMHPPRWYALLHTLSSFFPGKFLPSLGYAINFFSIVIIELLMIKLIKKINGSNALSLICCAFLCFSLYGMDMSVFIRMYTFTAMFTMLTVYYSYKFAKCEKVDKNAVRYAVINCICIYCGAMSEYLFAIFAAGFTFITLIAQLKNKQWKKSAVYAASCALGIALMLVSFPSVFSQISINNRGMKFDAGIQLRFSIGYAFFDIFGTRMSEWYNGELSYVAAAVVLFLAVAAPLCFLFRNEKWFAKPKAALIKAKNAVPSLPKRIWKFLGSIDFIYYAMFFGAALHICLMASLMAFQTMGKLSTRYYIIIAPILIILMFAAMRKILSLFKFFKPHINKIISCLCILILVVSHIFTPITYFAYHPLRMNLEEYIENQNVLALLSDGPILTHASPELIKANNIYVVSAYELANKGTLDIKEPEKLGDSFIMIISMSVSEKKIISETETSTMASYGIVDDSEVTLNYVKKIISDYGYSEYEELGITEFNSHLNKVYKISK